ncbi:hypothetical protein EJ03DRAFT_329412 [Teratosphaeria nubilosa]|uniref:FAD-binding domain-containing protein n=1 Tax=Teratosphaeria nubilosa TaxID=161662 RepID=A0A6G1L2P0_9PEZI|nr:hypothetical protein EJ03DRAFT_329412 [Teratosphaeria nubilosa]
MTRLYIELKPEGETPMSKSRATEDFVIARAKQIMVPYLLSWHSVEWFGVYVIAQRVAKRFMDDSQQVFIAGDASHTHSPKAAQGMNTSMHDTLNLGWKLNLSIRGLAKPELLATYEHERRKIAQDLIDFDYEHANAFHAGDAKALAENLRTNIRFISGVGAEYGHNVLNRPLQERSRGALSPGMILAPARATRYVDANPVDLQLDVPMLGQFRIYFLCGTNLTAALPFLTQVCYHVSDSHSSPLHRLTTAAKASYGTRPRPSSGKEAFMQLQRYVAASELFTYALVTAAAKDTFEIADLPPLLQASRWTVYLDDIPESDTRRQTCLDKWLGGLMDREVAIVNVRPDGYVGSVGLWDVGEAAPASSWLDDYYSAFLQPA